MVIKAMQLSQFKVTKFVLCFNDDTIADWISHTEETRRKEKKKKKNHLIYHAEEKFPTVKFPGCTLSSKIHTKFSFYLNENIIRLDYKDQSLYNIWWKH